MGDDFSTSTKWILISCPGKKVPIRKEPKVQSEIMGYISSGDKIEVSIQTVGTFYCIQNKKGYINKATNGVEYVDVATHRLQDVDELMDEQLETAADVTPNFVSKSIVAVEQDEYVDVDIHYLNNFSAVDDDEQQQQKLLKQFSPNKTVPQAKDLSSNILHVVTNASTLDEEGDLESNDPSSSSAKYALYANDLHEFKNNLILYYNQVGTLQPWDEFLSFYKQPQCNFHQLDQRLSFNFLKYRSNYLSIVIVITTSFTLYGFIFYPIFLLLLIPFLLFSFYCLIANKSSMRIGEITITTKGKKYAVLLVLTILLGVTDGLTYLVWILLFSCTLCLLHMFFTPKDGLDMKSQSV